MSRSLLVSALLFALLPALCDAQEPVPPPPEEVEETEPQEEVPSVEPAESDEDSGEEAGSSEGDQDEGEGETAPRILTPEEEELKRKAAEKAAKREERRERRAAKAAEEEAKRAGKRAREALKRNERADELIALGLEALEAGKYKDAQEQFDKARELEGGTSYDAEMGVARLELARQNYAEAVRFAQRAVEATLNGGRKAAALAFAGEATLAARPLIDGDPERPQPGSEMFVDSAFRFFIRAVEVAPFEADEALARLEARFPGGETDPRTARLLTLYLETFDNGEARYGRQLASTYETLLAGRPLVDRPVAVVAPISAPRRLSGARPQVVTRPGAPAKRRLVAGFVVQPDGSVSRVEILDQIPGPAEAQARQVLMGWTFEPARLPDGTPVAAYWLQGVNVSPE